MTCFENLINFLVSISVVKCYRICTDHNEDNSVAIIRDWLNHTHNDYNNVDLLVDESEIGIKAFSCWFNYNLLYFTYAYLVLTDGNFQ